MDQCSLRAVVVALCLTDRYSKQGLRPQDYRSYSGAIRGFPPIRGSGYSLSMRRRDRQSAKKAGARVREQAPTSPDIAAPQRASDVSRCASRRSRTRHRIAGSASESPPTGASRPGRRRYAPRSSRRAAAGS
jgi:hypothetical protein